jgi:hypothetical protein
MLTARDSLNVGLEADDLLRRLCRFSHLDVEEARSEFQLGPDKRDWKIALAQEDLRASGIGAKQLRRVAYRPFDDRVVFYTGQSKGLIGQPGKLLAEAIDASGLALGTIRRVEEGEFRHAFAYSLLPDGHSVSSKEITHVFPLYILPKQTKAAKKARIENFSTNFREFIDSS